MAVALVFKAAGVLPKMCGHMTALPAHFTADNSRHFLCLHAKHTRIHLTQPTAPLSSMCRRRGIFVSAVQAQETELSGEETAVSDWEGDGDSVIMDEVAGWDEAEADSLVIDEESLAKLFVGNLPYDMDSEMLAQLFQQAGDVEIAEVIYNRETDQSRGFGFVTMKSVEEAQNAVEKLNGLNVEGKMLTVKKAAPKGSRQETRGSDKIYVGNLPWSVDEGRLREVFSEYGKVVDSKVVYDRESRRSRGFGFLTMSSKQEMDNAIASLDGQNLDGRTIRVNAAEEKPRRGSF